MTENRMIQLSSKTITLKQLAKTIDHSLTGFAPTGATMEDIHLMRRSVGPQFQVKAAQGVRTLDPALQMIDAGVTRMGATATATILDDFARFQAQK
jgi:deoxyribose-phosphate aldolase